MERLRLQLSTSCPLSNYPQATKPKVPAYPHESIEIAFMSHDMTALFFTQEAIPACNTATQCFVYRLSCRTIKACEPPCDATSKTVGLGPRVSLNFNRRWSRFTPLLLYSETCLSMALQTGFEPVTYRCSDECSTNWATEMKFLQRCARPGCFMNFWIMKYNTPFVFLLPDTQPFFRIPSQWIRCPLNCTWPLLAMFGLKHSPLSLTTHKWVWRWSVPPEPSSISVPSNEAGKPIQTVACFIAISSRAEDEGMRFAWIDPVK